MSCPNDIKEGEKLVLSHPEIGYVRATAAEDGPAPIGLAFFRVYVNSSSLPGVSEMVVNVNFWDVFREDDPGLLKGILNAHVPYHMTR